MRWSDLFDHLENDFARESDSGLPRALAPDDYLLEMCARAKKAQQTVTIALVTGEIVHLNPRGIGLTWVSALSGGHQGAAMIIPVHAIDWVEGHPDSDHVSPGRIADVSLDDVVDDLIARNVSLTVRTRHGAFRGTLVGHGVDYLDCALTTPHALSPIRRFSRRNLVMLVLGEANWG